MSQEFGCKAASCASQPEGKDEAWHNASLQILHVDARAKMLKRRWSSASPTFRQYRKQRRTCEHCSFTSNARSVMLAHEKTHVDVSHYTCDSCAATFKDAVVLLHHQKLLHYEECPYSCRFCKQVSFEEVTRSFLRPKKRETSRQSEHQRRIRQRHKSEFEQPTPTTGSSGIKSPLLRDGKIL